MNGQLRPYSEVSAIPKFSMRRSNSGGSDLISLASDLSMSIVRLWVPQ